MIKKISICSVWIIILAFASCSFFARPGIEFEDMTLHSNKRKFDYLVPVAKIEVGQFSDNGIPVVFNRIESASLYLEKGARPRRRIYFSKKNPGYYWKTGTYEQSDTFPIKFEPNSWYIIDGLRSDRIQKIGTSDVCIFLYYGTDSIEFIHVDHISHPF